MSRDSLENPLIYQDFDSNNSGPTFIYSSRNEIEIEIDLMNLKSDGTNCSIQFLYFVWKYFMCMAWYYDTVVKISSLSLLIKHF